MAQDYDDKTEYQLNEDDDNVVYDAASEEKLSDSGSGSGKNPLIAKKNAMIILVSVIVIVLILYKLFTLLFAGNSAVTTTVQNAKSTIPTMTVPKATTTKAVLPSALQPAKAITKPSASSAVQSNQKRLNGLEENVTSIKTNLSGLQNSIQSLTMQLQKTESAQRAAIITRAQAKKVRAATIRHNKRYFVRAVIPGRAWLEGADGTAMTITVGNLVPGYGKVTSIDAYSGAVKTSSGININYGVSEE